MIRLDVGDSITTASLHPRRLHSSKIGDKQVTTFPCGHQLSSKFIEKKMPNFNPHTDRCPVCQHSIENLSATESDPIAVPSGGYWLTDYFFSFLCSGNTGYAIY